MTWSPIAALNLIASVTNDEQAPTAQQLGNPVISTPNVCVFDFVRGEPAFVTLISGGNTGLAPSDREVLKVNGTLRPVKADLSITADYVRAKTTGGINALPPASLASQAAFPGRYTRNANGILTSVDSRTVNFAETDASEIRWGFNVSKPLKTSQSQIDALRAAFQSRYPNGVPGRGPGGERGGPSADRGPGAGPRGPGGPGGGGGGGGRGGFGGGGGRLNFAVYHTLHLTDSVILQPGQPRIDLLRGGTIGSGGQPRHEVEVQTGLSKNGFGARLTGNWQSATRVRWRYCGRRSALLRSGDGQPPPLRQSRPVAFGYKERALAARRARHARRQQHLRHPSARHRCVGPDTDQLPARLSRSAWQNDPDQHSQIALLTLWAMFKGAPE